MSRARRLASAASLAALGAALAACSTILGFESVTIDSGDGGGDGGAVDATSDVAPDAPRTDAPTDVAADTPIDTAVDTSSESCGNTMTDAANCGRCGHSCLRGMCQAGVCQPYALSTGYFGPWDLALDATHVYFTLRDDNKVYKASNVDGSGATKLADQPDAIVPFAIAVDSTAVYWTNRSGSTGEVRKCALAGCPVANTSTLIASSVSNPASLIVVGSKLVWSANGSGIVQGANSADGTSPFTLFSNNATSPYQLATDSTYVYFTDNSDGVTQRVPFDGGAPTALSNNGVMISSGIAVAGGNVFFGGGDINGGVLWRIAASQFTSGASASSYASSLKQPAGVAVDSSYVYWVNTGGVDQNDGSVMACPLTGCTTPITLATGQHYPVRIKVDADAVYWTNYGVTTSATDGSIWKVAKP